MNAAPRTPPVHEMPFVRIELAVFAVADGRLQVLLGRRAEAPHAGRWALPGGVLRPLALERRCQLLAYLALRREPVPRAELGTLLWPEQGRAQALGNLRTALFRAQTLDWAAALEPGPAALRFTAATDVQDFENALHEGRGADALELMRGELMAGFDDGASEPWTRWLAFERDRLLGRLVGRVMNVPSSSS